MAGAEHRSNEGSICVVGLGNRYRRDDSVGLVVLEMLRSDLGEERVRLLPLGDDATALLDTLSACGRLVVVDGVMTGARPGHIHVWSWHPEFPALSARFSSHAISPMDVLRLAVQMGKEVPPTTIVGIEVDDVGHGTDISRSVRAALPTACALILDIVRERWRGDKEAGEV